MNSYRKSGFVILLTILAGLLLLTGCTPSGEEFRSYGKERVDLDKDARVYLLSLARATLEGKAVPADGPAIVRAPYSKEVFVTAFLPGVPHATAFANAGSIAESVRQAAEKLKAEPTFRKYFDGSLARTRLVVNVMDRVKKVKDSRTKPLEEKEGNRLARKLRRRIEPGVHGAILVTKGKAFFQLGEEVVWNCWGMEGEDRILGTKMFFKRMQKLSKEGGLAADAWETAALYRFTTHAFMEDRAGSGKRAIPLYRGNVLIGRKITRSQVLEAAARGGRNLGRNQDAEGQYGYIYYPCKDDFDASYNIVRHAGTTYSLFQIYQATGDPYYKDAALKALKYLEPYVESPEDDDSIALLKYKGRSALGSNALLTLALIEMPAELLDAHPSYRDLLDKLGGALLKYQMEDGSFYVHYRQVQRQQPPKKQPIYYPGETFLAFVRLYEKTKDRKYLEAATRAADYQLGDFEKSGVPCNWATQAYSRYYRQNPKEKYALACYAMADELLTHQWGTFKEKKMPFRDFYGGADNSWPPRSTPTASRAEALTEAYDLAAFRKDEENVQRYGKAVLASLWFDMNHQYRPGNTYFLPTPHRALGGIKGSPIANDIRIDYTQHFMTAAIHGLHIAEKFNGKGRLASPLGILDVAATGLSLAEAEKQVLSNQGKDFAAPQEKSK